MIKQFPFPTLYTRCMKSTLIVLVSASLSGIAFAESSKDSAAAEYVNDYNAAKAAQSSIRVLKEKWDKKQQIKLKQEQEKQKNTVSINELLKNKQITLPKFPAPPQGVKFKPEHSSASDVLSDRLLALLTPVVDFLIPSAEAAGTVYGTVTVDGDLAEWSSNDRINFPIDKPPYLADPIELYGKFINATQTTPAVYVFALKSPAVAIQPDTTFYINADQNTATGSKNVLGGADFYVNIYTDSAAHLYNQAGGWLAPLDYAYNPTKNIIEIVVPATSIALPANSAPHAINIYSDINDKIFLPADFSGQIQFTINTAASAAFPSRTDSSKRVGIVYSLPSKNNFYAETAYSQLYMALQHHAMMAGISFDLLTEDDLTNLNKLVNYDALIFPYGANITASKNEAIRNTLYSAIYKNPTGTGLGIITADNWLTSDELNTALPSAYKNMQQLLGISRAGGTAAASNIDVVAGDVQNPNINYATNETIISYPAGFTSYFQPVTGQAATYPAFQTISGIGKVPGVIATTTKATPPAVQPVGMSGGRNVHFASTNLLGDTALAWQAIQWVVYGTETPVALKMGRNSNLFVSRNDMDVAMERDLLNDTEVALLPKLAKWKTDYNFVGSYYIDIGNDVANGEYTEWAISGPLYKKYIELDNEIGTHSWTHPHDTNILTSAQTDFEFNQSMNEILKQLGPTWRNQLVRGSAVPGMPETIATSNNLIQYLDYLSGGWTGIGSGFPSAFGYQTPESTKVYFAPNMTFDFTMIEFGVLPRNQYGVPTSTSPTSLTKLTPSQATSYWQAEITRLMSHASQPIIHWAWHDYAATIDTTTKGSNLYSDTMMTGTLATAKAVDSEFVTVADLAQRITTFRQAKTLVNRTGNVLTAQVNSANVGKFSLSPSLTAGQKIQGVTGWYAYNDKQVFLPDAGGNFAMQIGTTSGTDTHITSLPMRARLITASGDGNKLNFSFEGEGTVNILLSASAVSQGYTVKATNIATGADAGAVVTSNQNTRSISFAKLGQYAVELVLPPPALVTAYQQTNYLGINQGFNAGTYDVSPTNQFNIVGNDKINSLKVAANYAVKACENTGGLGICSIYTANTANVGTLANKISYLQITPTASALPVTAYQNANYTGIKQQFTVGTFNASNLNIVGTNKISSIQVATGYSVKACTSGLLPTCSTYTSNQATLSLLMDNKINSLVITKL